MSCDLESSTSILAVGWKTCRWLMIVAPSLVMITSPSLLWIILSIPLGPSDERTASETPAGREEAAGMAGREKVKRRGEALPTPLSQRTPARRPETRRTQTTALGAVITF
jgi:hypothetical protein